LIPRVAAAYCYANVEHYGPEGVVMAPDHWNQRHHRYHRDDLISDDGIRYDGLRHDFRALDALILIATSNCYASTEKANRWVPRAMGENLLNSTRNILNNIGIPPGYMIPFTTYEVTVKRQGLLGEKVFESPVLFLAKTNGLGAWVGAVADLNESDVVAFRADTDRDDRRVEFVVAP
jgi:hypothetical protein